MASRSRMSIHGRAISPSCQPNRAKVVDRVGFGRGRVILVAPTIAITVRPRAMAVVIAIRPVAVATIVVAIAIGPVIIGLVIGGVGVTARTQEAVNTFNG